MRNVERVLIPGYVFAQFDPEKRLPVLTIPGVSHLVGTRSGPLPVAVEELEALRLISMSGAFAESWTFPAAGQAVYVAEGPLRGLRGSLVGVKNTWRVIVSVSLLQRAVGAEVDREWIRLEPLAKAGKASAA